LTRQHVPPLTADRIPYRYRFVINEYCTKALGLRDEQVPHNIHKYGNTTAATIPLLWDECVRDGRLQPGDLVLMVAFGAGMTWGASLLRA
jgi:3-oxoacyl-[acyl-carrier-protein] synthase-3